MIRRWTIRHYKTGVMVGHANLDIPDDRLDPKIGANPYHFAIYPPLSDLWKTWAVPTDLTVSDFEGTIRKATVWINPGHPHGRHTLWVKKASELVGLESFSSCL